MSRRRSTTLLDDLVAIATLLPYWMSLALAVISYLALHYFATQPVEPVIRPGSALPDNMMAIILSPFLSILQYVIPFAFVMGALVSAIKAYRGQQLANRYVATSPNAKSARGAAGADGMSWQQFELLVGQAFRQQGFKVIDGGEIGADGGVDVHLRRDGQTFLVQCKHWKARSVGVSVLRELYGVMASAGAAGGFIVTSGAFTTEAQEFARGKSLNLIDGQDLDIMLRQAAKSSPDVADTPPGVPTDVPACPKCAAPMARRVSKRGAYAGQTFWGCSRYPKCRGMRQ